MTQTDKSKNCPVCMKLMRTHTYSDLTDCMEKLFGMIDVSHSNKNQDKIFLIFSKLSIICFVT